MKRLENVRQDTVFTSSDISNYLWHINLRKPDVAKSQEEATLWMVESFIRFRILVDKSRPRGFAETDIFLGMV